MNLVTRQIYGLKKISSPNTFIGGVSPTIGTAQLLATALAINVSMITNFSVVGSDIKCRITGSYVIPGNCFLNSTSITSFIDKDNLVTNIGESSFRNTTLISELNFEGVITHSAPFSNRNSNVKRVILKNCTAITAGTFYTDSSIMEFYYIARATTLGNTVGDEGIFYNASTYPATIIYTNPFLQTNNAGSEDGDIAYARSKGCVIRYVTSFTAPNPVTTLTTGTIYNTAIQLNFTPPSSANAIDYYECYANGVFYKIGASGDYVTKLTASTSYVFTIYARDIFYNLSLVSNSITQSTNTTNPSVPTTGLVSYFKFDSNSNDSYGLNNGVDTSVTYGVGKIGNAVVYNGSTSKTVIGNPANLQLSQGTVCAWIKTSGAGSSYRCIFSKENAYALFLVDGVLMFYNWGTFGAVGNKSTGINLNDGLWHHVALVFENGTANNYIYIDGVLKLTFSMGVLNQTSPFQIGQNSGTQFINATIDEMPIYSTKLKQFQIDLIYNAGTGTTL